MILATVRMAIPPHKRDEALKSSNPTAAAVPGYAHLPQLSISPTDVQEESHQCPSKVGLARTDLERHLRLDEYHKVLLVMEMGTRTARHQVRHHFGIDRD